MTPRDWFVVGVRLLGVWQLLQCALWVSAAIALHLQLSELEGSSVRGLLFQAGIEGGIGILLLTVAAPLLWRERVEPEGFEVAPSERPTDNSAASSTRLTAERETGRRGSANAD